MSQRQLDTVPHRVGEHELLEAKVETSRMVAPLGTEDLQVPICQLRSWDDRSVDTAVVFTRWHRFPPIAALSLSVSGEVR